MVDVKLDSLFEKKISKIRHLSFKVQVKNQIAKIVANPLVGKPMRYARRGTREVYIGSFRLVYSYSTKDALIQFLDLYHKDEQ
jgi:mRNA-degrading endonuclease RelE of RelBE toxin-antitoxin system